MRLAHRFFLGILAAWESLPFRGALTVRTETPLPIGIIGAGWLGGTVGRLWVEAGHKVLFSSRHPEELVSMARRLGPNASAGTMREAAEFGSILLFAVPYDGHDRDGMSGGRRRQRSAGGTSIGHRFLRQSGRVVRSTGAPPSWRPGGFGDRTWLHEHEQRKLQSAERQR
jgi:hypothetical protein